jgi:hypothetical protein
MPEYTTEIEIYDIPVEVTVEYEYEPPCGDGWHGPRFPEQINIYMVKDKSGNEVDFLDHEAFLEQEISADIQRQGAEWAADRAEYLYECRKDALMDGWFQQLCHR